LNAAWVAVAPGGAVIVTFLLMFVMLVTFVVLVMFVMRMPVLMIGGALVTTAGAVPMGAGTTSPRRDPGGAGTKTPGGPKIRGPRITPAATTPTAMATPTRGGSK
jgi:hypothetical protein